MSRVFISFLGTNQYVWCNYEIEASGQESCVIGPVRFVQEALIRHFCKDWNGNDRFIFFLTKDAWKKNWDPESDDPDEDDNFYSQKPLWGLRRTCEVIRNDGFNIRFEPVADVPEGFTEQQMWELFNIIVEHVHEGDDVFLDITHGFRNLPMLANVLLDYLRVTKNTTVGGIYYGAFDSIGPAYKVKQLPSEKRHAPIVNLTRFHELQQWVDGAEQLIKYGNPKKVCEVIKIRADQSLKRTKGKDIASKYLLSLQRNLAEIYDAYVTIRGSDIIGFDPMKDQEDHLFRNTRENLEKVISSEDGLPPLKPLLEKMRNSLTPLEQETPSGKLLAAARWCANYDLLPQAYTFLREAIIDFQIEKEGEASLKTHFEKNIRKSGEDALNCSDKKELKGTVENLFYSTSNPRNDIDHAGMRRDPKKMKSLVEEIKKLLAEAESIVN